MNFNLSSSYLLASLFWSSIGAGFTVYGKRQREIVPMLGGIALIAVSWLISSAVYMSLASVGLILGIIWLKRSF